MHKFRVGDIIIGNKKNTGFFTGVDSICRVTNVYPPCKEDSWDIEVYIIKGKRSGERINASSYTFDLYNSNFRRVT